MKTVFQPTIENVDIVDQIEDYAESLQPQDEGQQEQLPDIDPDEVFINLLHQGWETIVCTCHTCHTGHVIFVIFHHHIWNA